MVSRLVVSSPSSSSGKTTLVCGLSELISKRLGGAVSVLKIGPDFIDPLFHAKISGRMTGNIDLYFTDEKKSLEIFEKDVSGSEFALVEGAMGFLDGVGGDSFEASAFHTTETLDAPVLFVVDMKGKSLSVCAEILGFVHIVNSFGKQNRIFGVVLNRCSKSLYEKIAPKIREICGIETLGFLENNPDFELKSRHLGLVTPDAVENLQEKIEKIASSIEKTVDVEKILSFCKNFSSESPEKIGKTKKNPSKVKIAVARDEAFCFYYRENLELLEDFGAELCFFSPLKNDAVPNGCSAMYIGGGYPELFSFELAENKVSGDSIRGFARSGAPVFAECGGFLYLQLLGILPGTFENKNHLVRFGYAEFTCREDNFLLKSGEKIRGHEFHYFDTTQNGSSFSAKKTSGAEWTCIQNAAPVDFMKKSCCLKKSVAFEKNIVAGFPHFYFPSNPKIAENFVDAAIVFDSLKNSENSSFGGCSNCGGCGGCHRNSDMKRNLSF